MHVLMRERESARDYILNATQLGVSGSMLVLNLQHLLKKQSDFDVLRIILLKLNFIQ